ncbi:hypothetical protein GCM10009788_38750 [Nocardioides humi]|uniref:Single-stranded DNA-binding protein n=1 Tax=Nocardioides humi TaxID=449461 RepID=A0ABN2B2N9_9ACTN
MTGVGRAAYGSTLTIQGRFASLRDDPDGSPLSREPRWSLGTGGKGRPVARPGNGAPDP